MGKSQYLTQISILIIKITRFQCQFRLIFSMFVLVLVDCTMYMLINILLIYLCQLFEQIIDTTLSVTFKNYKVRSFRWLLDTFWSIKDQSVQDRCDSSLIVKTIEMQIRLTVFDIVVGVNSETCIWKSC